MSSTDRPGLNVIGAGRVARLLARCWHEAEVFEVRALVTRRPESARAAGRFIGSGRPATSLDSLGPAEFWMIGTPDDSVISAADALRACGQVRSGDTVFHLSGALAADVLGQWDGANRASLHLLKTVPDAAVAYASFGTPCITLEGDPPAVESLVPACRALQAQILTLDADAKAVYQTANVMLCNYLVTLTGMGVDLYRRAGINSRKALQILGPLMQETLNNTLDAGPVGALTGPISRGDAGVVRQQLELLPPEARDVYRSLGRETVKLAAAAGLLQDSDVDALDRVLADVSRCR
ncbi:MAG: DUF2520 domain-containing protein [Xanthomonadales bacterium]|nr:DUF2520 domain-containing protein [Xanthomonadales bacterium]